jgi:hypothetical protein
MKIMTVHSSAAEREQTPHPNNSTYRDSNSSHSRNNSAHSQNNSTSNQTITDALKQRAQRVINDKSINPETRAIIRYGLEIDDPCLPELLGRIEAGETIFDAGECMIDAGASMIDEGDNIVDNLSLPPTTEQKLELLTEIICRAGDETSAALLVLMATLENAPHPTALANTAKHFAFTHCLNSNLYGIVDAQLAMIETELFATNSLAL